MNYAELLRGFINREVKIQPYVSMVVMTLRDEDAKSSRFHPTIADVGDDYVRLDYQKGKVRYFPISQIQFVIGDFDEK